jgi:hypothetical protein
MLVGYNTNVSYKGTIYHIQTEDSGVNNPVILTLLYSEGAILASKKTSYAHILEAPDSKEKIEKLMKAQHKVMIKELLSGKYTGGATKEEVQGENVEHPKAEQTTEEQTTKEQVAKDQIHPGQLTKGQITTSLDDILINYIIKRR